VCFFTAAAVVLVQGFFAFTHTVPGLVLYFPITVVAFGCFVASLAATNGLPDGEEASGNLMPVVILPFAIAIDLALQWSSYAMIKLYTGHGYIASAWLTATERQLSVYVANLEDQVLGKATWLWQLINQLWP